MYGLGSDDSNQTHIIDTSKVFFHNLAILLQEEISRAKFEHCGAPLSGKDWLVKLRLQCKIEFFFDWEEGLEVLLGVI